MLSIKATRSSHSTTARLANSRVMTSAATSACNGELQSNNADLNCCTTVTRCHGGHEVHKLPGQYVIKGHCDCGKRGCHALQRERIRMDVMPAQ